MTEDENKRPRKICYIRLMLESSSSFPKISKLIFALSGLQDSSQFWELNTRYAFLSHEYSKKAAI